MGDLGGRNDARIHTHAAETPAELRQVDDRHGGTPIEVLRDTGLLGPNRARPRRAPVRRRDGGHSRGRRHGCPLPRLEPEARSGVARVPELLAAGVPVAIGTDGAALANDLDMWLAMRLAAYPLAARAGVGTVAAARRAGDGDDRRRRAPPVPRTSARSRSAPAPTSSCSTRRHRRSPRPTTRSRRPSTPASRADVRWVVAGGRLVVDDRRLTTLDVDAAIATVRELGAADPGGDGPVTIIRDR